MSPGDARRVFAQQQGADDRDDFAGRFGAARPLLRRPPPLASLERHPRHADPSPVRPVPRRGRKFPWAASLSAPATDAKTHTVGSADSRVLVKQSTKSDS